MDNREILKVEHCSVQYGGLEPAVNDVSFSIKEHEIVSIVGESGSGKSTLLHAIMGLLPPQAHVKGNILFKGTELVNLPEHTMKKIRGNEITMIFQDSGRALDPIKKIKKQYTEAIKCCQKLVKSKSLEKEREMLLKMHLSDPDRVLQSYPFELSGGMKQRVGISMSMTSSPVLLLADEPTSALDVTIQAQVVYQIQELREVYGTSIILVTHNMGVASYLSDKIGVMYKGELVEWGSREEVILNPHCDYTKDLLKAVPGLSGLQETGRVECVRQEEDNTNLLVLENISKCFSNSGKQKVAALKDVSLVMKKGECLGIVGESGCGKSTLARIIAGSIEDASGNLYIDGKDNKLVSQKERREISQLVQMVFQDPASSFSPRMKIGTYIGEPLRNYRKMKRGSVIERVQELMEFVQLPSNYRNRYPHQLSGGELQRAAIARAISINPKLIILDEATSALDVSIQKKIMELLKKLQEELGLAYLVISHDLALVQNITSRVLIMYRGIIVEEIESSELTTNAFHPYTKELLDSVFEVYDSKQKERNIIKIEKQTREEREEGCVFKDRCPYPLDICRNKVPVLKEIEKTHRAACFHR